MTALSQVFPASTAIIGGSFSTDASGNVSGVAHIYSVTSNCFDPMTDVPVTGTTTKAGQLALTSAAVAGQVVTVGATVSADGSTLSAGTYSVAGGCDSGDHGTLTGAKVQSFSGNYTGTFTSKSGGAVNVSGTVTQSATADSHGFFGLSGTAAFTGSPCFASATIQSSSEAAGFLMVLNLSANDGSTIQFIGAADDATTKTIHGQYSVSGGSCAGDSGSGTLNH